MEMRQAITTTRQSHKRQQDDFLATSSDPPMFSSDPPLFTTSIDDYQGPRKKHQRRGPWFDTEEEATELRVNRKNRKSPGLGQTARQRRSFRKFDSGIFMGSDESIASESSESIPTYTEAHVFAECTVTEEDERKEIDDMKNETSEVQKSMALEASPEGLLFVKATQTVEDPGGFEGPVFPYWQEQPVNLKHFHTNQKLAHDKVLRCVDRGKEVVDLS